MIGVQVPVASVNLTLDPTLLSSLGIPYNLSEMGEALGLLASLSVDFVQRFNFSAADDGVITFMSPHVRSTGYAPVQVFDKDGAATVDAEALFYNLKVILPWISAEHASSLSSIQAMNGLCDFCAVSSARILWERGGLHALPQGPLRSHALLARTQKGQTEQSSGSAKNSTGHREPLAV